MHLNHPDALLISYWQELERIEANTKNMTPLKRELAYQRYFRIFEEIVDLDVYTLVGVAIQISISGRAYVTGEEIPTTADQRMYANAAKYSNMYLRSYQRSSAGEIIFPMDY